MKKRICILIFYMLMLLLISRCNVIIDKTRDNEMTNTCTNESYANYCKPIGECPTGTHVMCEAYREGQVMGHYCDNGRMIKLLNDSKLLILDKINRFRGSIVAGNVTGNDDLPLQRGYGLRRLYWNRDLAIFAQVWANQCRQLREDECRATKIFPNPGQMVHVTENIIKNNEKKPNCVTHELIINAIEDSIQSWYDNRYHTTKEMVVAYTDIKIDNRFKKNYFLMMGNDQTTHVGCGMSGYDFYNSKANRQVYVLLLVCNFSHQAKIGEQSFNIVKPPVTDGYSEQCGCPPGSYEDEYCLCVGRLDNMDTPVTPATAAEDVKRTEPGQLPDHTATPPAGQTETNSPEDDNRYHEKTSNNTPAVLILPIITVANAPPEKYQQQMRLIDKKLIGYSRKVFSSKNILNEIDKYTNVEKPLTSQKKSIFTNVPTFHLPSQDNIPKQQEKPKEPIVLKNKLISLLEQVPTKLLSRLEDALETLKQKRDKETQTSTTLSPITNSSPRPKQMANEVIKADGEAPAGGNYDGKIDKYNSPNKKVNDFNQQIDHGLESSFVQNYYKENNIGKQRVSKPSKAPKKEINNADDGNGKFLKAFVTSIQNGNTAVETLSIRKQFPITHGHKNSKHVTNNFTNNYKRNEFRETFKAQTDKVMVHNNKALTYYRNDDKINDYNPIALDNKKSKRKMYLENEINKLKRKLQYLRQYIRRNDIIEKDHFRPMVTQNSYNERIKTIDADQFYLPDRAHSLYDI